jgi:hypothetical protein
MREAEEVFRACLSASMAALTSLLGTATIRRTESENLSKSPGISLAGILGRVGVPSGRDGMSECVQSQCWGVSALMFLVYGDESLDETQSRVCAVGGLVGTEAAWISLEAKWKSLHGEIPFHANHCESDQGDYAPRPGEHPDERHKANQSLYKASVIAIAESDIGGFASAYDLAAQRIAFPPPYAPPVYYQPFLDVLQAMVTLSMNWGLMAKLTFDSRVESEHNAALIYANLRENSPGWTDRLAGEISFVSSRKCARIQMADLFARESMKVLDNQVGPIKREPRRSWEALELVS